MLIILFILIAAVVVIGIGLMAVSVWHGLTLGCN